MSSATGPVPLPEDPRDPILQGSDEAYSSPDKTEAQTSSWVEEPAAQATFFANEVLVHSAPLDVLSSRLPKMHEEVAIWDDELVALMIRFATA